MNAKLFLMLWTVCACFQVVRVEAQEWAREKVENSPRHGEWVELKHGDRTVDAFVMYPEVSEKATAVIVIHEIFGLTDWVRGVADDLAEAGFIAICPDLLSQRGPNGGNTEAFDNVEAARRAIGTLPPDQITADLNAAVEYVKKLPACNGRVAVAGFCWGGAQAFRFATNHQEIIAAFPFYGSGPMEAESIARIKAPVFGFYGSNDARVNATIAESEKLMKAAGKEYSVTIYEGAGHGFLRMGEAPDATEANKKARQEALEQMVNVLHKLGT
jgi:carboxymethylenebutenolidase